jgi:energy-coupling factor transport system ATP-binding protein
MTLLALHDVVAWHGDECPARPALDGITLVVEAGDRVGLVGASGSGKSTLLHVLSGLLRPQRGTVAAQDAERLPSLVFQFPERQLFAETVREDIGYGLRESGVAPADVAARVDAALAGVGLPPAEFGARPPFHLSGGEMRRVALAAALAQQRPVVLLDEPTLGLDAEGLGRLADILTRMHAAGTATWIASHDADFLAATCDRIVALDEGRIAFDGPAASFWDDSDGAERLGVPVPRTSTLAGSLRAFGVRDLPHPADELSLLRRLSTWRPPPPAEAPWPLPPAASHGDRA